MKTNTFLTSILILLAISCKQKANQNSEVKYSSQETKANNEFDESQLLEKGRSISMKAQKLLASNLIQTINSKGTEQALKFCSEKAVPLTDSIAKSLDAYVKRVSDKTRNPANKANEVELAYIKKNKQNLLEGKSIDPELIISDEKIIGLYPIVTNGICLQCHGQPNVDITPSTLAIIDQIYPQDQAKGYKTAELRGIWVIEMAKN